MDASLKLSDSEHRCFWEMFNYLDGDSCGVLSMNQVYELFLTSGVGTDTIHQILELSGAKQGHLSRNQFFVALKLIAAAQNKYPVVLDVCYSGIELPLPRFMPQSESWRGQNQASLYSQQQMQQHLQLQQHLHQLHLKQQVQFHNQQVKQQIPQETYHDSGPRMAPVQSSSRSMSLACSNEASLFPQNVTTTSSMYLPSCPPLPSSTGKFISPVTARKQSAPVVVQPPQHTINNIGMRPRNESAFVDLRPEKGWASFEEDPRLQHHHHHLHHHFQQQLQQNQQQPIQMEQQKDWANFPSEGPNAEAVQVCSEEDVWCMTDEQRDYYINQFKTMQEDLKGTISGAIAKEFFEKSKLPVKELSKIWQLSDVNRDGVLTLPEFCTAMHLVVLRRNDIELPDQLPPSLMNQLQSFPCTEPVHNGQGDDTYGIEGRAGAIGYKKSSASPSSSLSSQVWNSGYSAAVESPTSSSVSSPGNKATPVNFEFQPVTFDPDSKIVQPVAVKMSPDDTPFVVDSDVASFSEESHDIMTSSMIQKVNKQDLLIDLDTEHETSAAPAVLHAVLQGRPRPTPIKPSVPTLPQDSITHVNKKLILPPPSSSSSSSLAGVVMATERSDVPPPPPPRMGHSRNSSLDNQLISLSPEGTDPDTNQTQTKFPPAVPPRPSSKERTLSSPEDGNRQPSLRKKAVTKHDSLDRRDLQASIRLQKERNLVLTRVNSELNQELQEVMEQRIALEIQMEHLQG